MPRFNQTLCRFRAAAGYRTAYAFYHSNGGRRVFPFTYAYYAKIERGESLPRPEWLLLIIQSLRAVSAAQKALLTADYLSTFAGPAFDELFSPMIVVPAETPAHSMLRNLRGRLTVHVTPKQLDVLAASAEAYGCFLVLVSSGEALPAENVADAIGSTLPTTRTALDRLRRAGLVRKRAGSRFEIGRAGCHYDLPCDPASLKVRAALRPLVDELFSRGGADVYDGWVTARLPPTDAAATQQEMQEVFQRVTGRAVSGKMSVDAPLYLIEGRIRHLSGKLAK